MSTTRRFFFRRLAMWLLGMAAPAVASAQSNLGSTLLTDSATELQNLATKVVTLIQVVMGLGAMVVLVMIILKVMKGDRESTEKLAWWVAGLVIGLVALYIVKKTVFGG